MRINVEGFEGASVFLDDEFRRPSGTVEATSLSDCYTISEPVRDFTYVHKVGGRDKLYIRRFRITNRTVNCVLEVSPILPNFAKVDRSMPLILAPNESKELLVMADIPRIKEILFDGQRTRDEELSLVVSVERQTTGKIFVRQ